MLTFVSHSFKDRAVYSTLCLALDAANIERWNADSLSPGQPLADQLKRSINACDICVFIATRRSVESPWCLAELGAFWGAGKRVLLFMADPDLDEASLPPQFSGILRADNGSALIDAIKSTIAEGRSSNLLVGNTNYYSTCAEVGGERDWMNFLQQSEAQFDVLGVAIGAWRRAPGFRDASLAKAQSGCRLRFLFMHQDNPLLRGLSYEGREFKTIVDTISEAREYFANLADAHENIEARQIVTGLPHFSIARADGLSILTQYLSTETWGSGPTWKCNEGSSLHTVVVREFEHLWKHSNSVA